MVDKIVSGWKKVFTLDLRSLALMRVGVAFAILWDLCVRAQDLEMFYTDAGVVPRGFHLQQVMPSWWVFSFHLINGTLAFQILLFLISAVLALALMVGYKTKWTTFFSWVMLLSIQNRNYLIGQGGDVLLRVCMFWGLFLPWGKVYSWDSIKNPIKEASRDYFSFATFALHVQVIYLYTFAAIFKTSPEWRVDNTAIYYALSFEQLTYPTAKFLLGFPKVMKVMTVSTFWLEALGGFLFCMPFWTRGFKLLGVVSFLALHLGIKIFIDVGLFTYVALPFTLAFLPSTFWDWIFAKLKTVKRTGLKIYYDGDCSFCKMTVLLMRNFFLIPETQVLPSYQNIQAQAEMNQRNSWVVCDSDGGFHYKFDGVLTVFKASPILFWLTYILNYKFIRVIGDKIYDFVASQRTVACKYIPMNALSPETPVMVKKGLLHDIIHELQNLLMGLVLIYAMFFNMLSIPNAGYKMPTFLTWMDVFRTDQAWNMFSPKPTTDDGWYVIQGRLYNDKEVDVYTGGGPLSWDKPPSIHDKIKNFRWHKYLEGFWTPKFEPYRGEWGKYICRKWNKSHDKSNGLESFEIFFMLERSIPPGNGESKEVPKIEKKSLLKWHCYE